jgi:hypothetical protein
VSPEPNVERSLRAIGMLPGAARKAAEGIRDYHDGADPRLLTVEELAVAIADSCRLPDPVARLVAELLGPPAGFLHVQLPPSWAMADRES